MKYETALKMLKPCPFCGRAPEITTAEDYGDLMVASDDQKAVVRIMCPDCHVEMYDHSYDFPAYEDRLVLITSKWNRRAKS
jgi:hypothetical protein